MYACAHCVLACVSASSLKSATGTMTGRRLVRWPLDKFNKSHSIGSAAPRCAAVRTARPSRSKISWSPRYPSVPRIRGISENVSRIVSCINIDFEQTFRRAMSVMSETIPIQSSTLSENTRSTFRRLCSVLKEKSLEFELDSDSREKFREQFHRELFHRIARMRATMGLKLVGQFFQSREPRDTLYSDAKRTGREITLRERR